MKKSRKYRLMQRAKKAELNQSGGTPQESSFHRRAYHRNFEGYSESRQLNKYGKNVIVRTYTGNYYEPKLSMQHRITLRMFYILFFVGGIALFAYTATRLAPCNAALYVNLFQALCIPMALWCVYVLIFYVPSIRKMTIGEYDTEHKSLIKAARMTACSMWATALMALLFLFLHIGTSVLTNLLCILGFAISGGLIFVISVLENMLQYEVIGNTATAPPGSTEIE